MKNKENNFLKKDYPVAICISWVKNYLQNKEQPIAPDEVYLEESASFQKLYDLISASPLTPIEVKRMAKEHMEKRIIQEKSLHGLMMGIVDKEKN